MKKSKNQETMRIKIPSTTDNIEWIISAVEIFAKRLELTCDDIEDIKAALREAICNCIRHAYKHKEGMIAIVIGEVKIKGIDESIIEIEVKDKGIGIVDVDQAMKPLFTTDLEHGSSGMGFTVMSTLMTALAVESAPNNGTTVWMRKVAGL